MGDIVTYSEQDGVSILDFDDGKANVFNPETVAALNAGLDRCDEANTGAMVLFGRPGKFSGGLDIKTLPALDQETRFEALTDYMEAMVRLFLSPKPLITAATGHALAGGCVMLLTGDVRMAEDGPYKIGLNETQIAIALPSLVADMAAAVISPVMQPKVMYLGTIHTPREALDSGIVHEVVAAGELREAAIARARSLLVVNAPAFAETKRRHRQELTEKGLVKLREELHSFFGTM